MPQLQLAFFPKGVTEINKHLAFMREGDTVTYIYGHLPIFAHQADDMQTFRLILSQIYVNGTATQAELARAFGITSISVRRSVKTYRKKGLRGFYEKRNGRGATVLTGSVLEEAQRLLDEGIDKESVSVKVGIKRDTLRKAIKGGRLHEALKKTVQEVKK